MHWRPLAFDAALEIAETAALKLSHGFNIVVSTRVGEQVWDPIRTSQRLPPTRRNGMICSDVRYDLRHACLS